MNEFITISAPHSLPFAVSRPLGLDDARHESLRSVVAQHLSKTEQQ